jgi:hypothetical protein
MTRRYLAITAFLLTSLLSLDFRCQKDPEPKPFEQTFLAPVNIFPVKKTYSLTDTIWIETDLPSKTLFDTRANQNTPADTGKITFGASFMEFGTSITNPPNGFCDVITANGLNTNRQVSQWETSGLVEGFGCGQSHYKIRIGFNPNEKGVYGLFLIKDPRFESCPNKVIPYHAAISYNYKNNVDMNAEIFNSLSDNDKGGKDGIKFYSGKINNREAFIFRVE